jgi:protein-tyrosine phosphatase
MVSGAPRMSPKPIRILFVCMGNICRSPVLAAILQKMVVDAGKEEEYFIDSCAVSNVYLGCQADARMRKAAQKYGFSVDHRAQIFEEEYYQTFDYIFAVDRHVLEIIKSFRPPGKTHAKIHLVTDFSTRYKGKEILDPYYDTEEGFDKVVEMAQEICEGLLEI